MFSICLIMILAGPAGAVPSGGPGSAAVSAMDAVSPEAAAAGVTVEVFLPRGRKSEAEKIKERFEEVGVKKVRFQYFKAGNPPDNIALGRDVPVSVARLAISLAIEYAQGVHLVVPQELLPATWVGIGTSAFDEQNQIPISEENLKRLRDPSLDQNRFHALYRELARQPNLY